MREHVNIDEAARLLEDGEAVIVGTDTVAGIAISSGRPDSLEAIYDAKERDREKPVAWLVAGKDDLTRYGRDAPEYVKRLTDLYWPGALTVVINASPCVSSAFVAENGTIGLRMPNDRACIALARKLGYALATTSANHSGLEPPKSIEEVDDCFAIGVPALDVAHRPVVGEPGKSVNHPRGDGAGSASTVIDCTGSRPSLIREGTIPFSDIDSFIDKVIGDGLCE